MANLLYNWHMDTTVDSDGDGDPENDIDIQGQWIEWTFNGYGSRTVKMTALDEGEGASVTLTVVILEAPFSLGEFVSDYGIILAFVLIVVIGAAVVLQKRGGSGRRAGPDSALGRKRISMDDAFDNPQYDPVSKEEEGFDSPSQEDDDMSEGVDESIESGADRFSGEGVAEAFEELTGEVVEEEVDEAIPDDVAVSVEEALDDEDIEALFED